MQASTFNENLWFAISEPSRRRLIEALLSGGEATASGLARQMTISRQAIAKHLSVLKQAGLVTSRQAGKEVRFNVQLKELDNAASELYRASQLWQSRLEKIKQISEEVSRQNQN
ncbi:MAG TPA: metalloregulator ArsR/SmtB family transcription factor [Candidatus Saccharimonadales bacterium]|nr:metalloregulator ArsR/SmtB family transcription factor [Candidatus Saccharimonadales bacterium]